MGLAASKDCWPVGKMANLAIDTFRNGPNGNQAAATDQDKLPIATTIFVLALVTPIIFNLGPIALNGTRLVLVCAFLPCLWSTISGKREPLTLSELCLIFFTLWFGIAFAFHHGLGVWERFGQNTLDSLGAYLLARTTIRNARQFEQLVKLLALAATLVVPFAFLEALTGRVFLNEILDRVPFWKSMAHVDGPRRLGLDRAQATFEHPILYGVFSSSLLVLCIMVRRSYAMGLLVMIGGCLSLSTAALLQTVLQLGMICWNVLLRSVRSRWLILVGLIVLGYVVLDLMTNRSPIRVFISYATFNSHTGYHRIHIWNYGIENVMKSPLFGIGLNDWTRPAWLHSDSVDNFWLLVAMWCGFPGVIALISGFVLTLVKVLRAKIDPSQIESRYRVAWVITIVLMSISLCTVHVWNATYSYLFFMLGAGFWLTQLREHNVDDDGEQSEESNNRISLSLRRKAPDAKPDRGTGSPYTRFQQDTTKPTETRRNVDSRQQKKTEIRYSRFD